MIKVKKYNNILGLLSSLFFIALILYKLDFHQLLNTFKTFNYSVLLLFFPLYIFSLYIRGVRLKCLLCNCESLTIKEAFLIFSAGNAFNIYFPARFGDFWRAYCLGEKLNDAKVKVFGTIALERILDGLSVLVILFVAIFSYFKQDWVLNIAYLGTSIFLTSLIILFLMLKFNKITFIFEKLSSIPFLTLLSPIFSAFSKVLTSFINGLEAMDSPKVFLKAFAISILVRIVECFMAYLLIIGFSQNLGFSVTLFIVSFSALATIIPSSSIFIGAYQYAYILALGIYHVDKASALSIAFIYQSITMIAVTLIAIIYFVTNKTAIPSYCITSKIVEE